MNVDFITAIKLFFANYANFRGRSTRAEYWFVQLFGFIVSMALSFTGIVYLSWLFALAIIVPSLALTTRRFHDAGYSGWWVLGFYVAMLVLLIIAFASIGYLALAHANDPEALSEAIKDNLAAHVVPFLICAIGCCVIGIWMLVIEVKPSVPDNQYGPDPYGEVA